MDGFSKFKNPQKENFILIFFLGLFFQWAWGCSPHSPRLNPGLPKCGYKDYWSSDPFLCNEGIKSIMTRSRYEKIVQYIIGIENII